MVKSDILRGVGLAVQAKLHLSVPVVPVYAIDLGFSEITVRCVSGG